MMSQLQFRHRKPASAVVVLVLLAWLAACSTHSTAELKPAENPKLITDIVTREDANTTIVTIKGNQPLTYTSVKQSFPLGLLLHFPETALDNIKEVYYPPENDTINAIRTTEISENGKAARIFIALKRDVPYDLSPGEAGLNISFPRAQGAAVAPVVQEAAAAPVAPAPEQAQMPGSSDAAKVSAATATRLESVTVTPLTSDAIIDVKADGAVRDYKIFTLDDPARIVVDMFNLKSPHDSTQKIPVASKFVQQVRHFGYPDKVRMVIETQKAYLKQFAATPVDNGLLVYVGQSSSGAATPPVSAVTTAPAAAASQTEPMAALSTKPAAAESTAWLNRIDFDSEEAGTSTVVVGTTHPVKYDLNKAGDRVLQLKLYDTNIPDYRKRALITDRFQSAVDRVTPVQTKQMKNNSVISIELREDVPYTVEQSGDTIRVQFAASTVSPKPQPTAAEVPAWKKAIAEAPRGPEKTTETAKAVEQAEKNTPVIAEVQAGAPEQKVAPAAQAAQAAPATPAEASAGEKKPAASAEAQQPTAKTKVYTGEKIALDFYDTDIKNVFRILKEISGKNFAIDKNVTGKVTLSLEQPVPWDQVLDLVLKMNQLGMTMEGDIIRIATLATLAQEDKLRQTQVVAQQQAQQAEKALEPLATEYIPINYSNAQTEVLPHLQNIITPDRGRVSVDQRNNQIIITDTEAKIKMAKEIVERIDRVTPQVVIEARVVEANSTFTRDLGFDWGTVTIGPFDIGDFSTTVNLLANNLPATVPSGEIGFSFIKMTGTPFSIVDAKLQASEAEGKTNIISAPKVVTLDNKKARIKQGLEVPYLERDSSGNATVRFKNVDLLLEVTPSVTPDNRITLNIFITKNDIAGTSLEGQPSLSTNEAQTELLVDDGDTVVIGGIVKSNISTSQQGIPGLANIPGLGWLFKSQSRDDSKNELLIFITPQIVQLEQKRYS
jgi:type IV pilus assembly protein PilQ